jgi:hypothetical protein
MKYDLTSIKKGWWSIGLPGYRHSQSTYTLYNYERLPPIPQDFDDNFNWLLEKPNVGNSLALSTYWNDAIPELNEFLSILRPIKDIIPNAFWNFIISQELHQRFHSVTSCELWSPDFIIKTMGGIEGYLFHFLADQQFCVNWFLHITQEGKQFVVASPGWLGYRAGELPREINLAQVEAYYCSPSFSEFIYRYWLENEIAWSLFKNIPLNQIQEEYVMHYKNPDK